MKSVIYTKAPSKKTRMKLLKNNKKKALIVFVVLLLTSSLLYAEDSQLFRPKNISLNITANKITLKHESNIYYFPSSTQDNYIGIKKVLREDIDGDGKKEYIIGARLLENPNDKFSYAPGYILIFKQNKDSFNLKKSFFVGDGLTGLKLFDVNKDGIKDIIAEGISGAHFSELKIISCQKGKYLTLWNTGSASGVFFKTNKKGNAQIKIGIPLPDKKGWSYASNPDWEIWTWRKNKFVYTEGKTKLSRIWQLQSPGDKENVPVFSKRTIKENK